MTAKKPGYSVISGKRVYTLPPKPPAHMLRLTLANKRVAREEKP